MDVSKFLWLIAEKKLHFARLDQLQDGFEGSSTRRTLDGIRKFLEGIGQSKGWENFRRIYRDSREKMYVNCWCCGDAESEAMWRLYCPDRNGVAIQTTYKKLTNSIEEDERLFIGRVTYADYESLNFPNSNLFYPVMHKRIAFSHESEVRVVCRIDAPEGEEQPLGFELDWDPQQIVDAVFVDPYGPQYHFQAVSAALRALAPDWETKLRWSQIKAIPVFE
jgi:hypothetical protein